MAVNNYIFLMFIPIILASNTCEQHKFCNECIRDKNQCVFCATENFDGIRCIPKNDIRDGWCKTNDIINPKSDVQPKENFEFNSEIGKVVQLKPQKMNIDIRPGETVNFTFAYKKAENYPIDLYFLFDGSSSMNASRHQTAKQSENIYRMMQSMTKNVLLGMGTYVDKNALPYTQIKNSTLTYSFRNRLQLMDQYEIFKKQVSESDFGSNYDIPEGTLDALAQVLVCKELIGWRKESRKIIIVITDQTYHVAGDGRWAGIFQPFDGKCYTENDLYKKELEMDYPSVGIINKLVVEDEFRVMFIVNQNVRNNYSQLSKNIEGSESVYITRTGKNIVALIKDILYKDINRNLKLKVQNSHSDFLQISFDPDCYKRSSYSKCKVKETGKIDFTGSIKLIDHYDAKNIKINLMIEGIKENLELNIRVLSDCDCANTQVNSSICNYGGTRRCGVCECDPGRNGDDCHNPNDNSTCIAPLDTVLCSDHGSCFEGKCLCREGYERKYCECIKDSCKLGSNGHPCSYPKGECDCGVCICKPGWTGQTCHCPTSTDCIDKEDLQECNNHGKCECGECKCNNKADWDARNERNKYCKLSCRDRSCFERQCINLEPLVLCHLKDDDCKYDSVMMSKEKNLTIYNESYWNQCPQLRFDVGCYTRFIYRYSDDIYEIEVIIQSDPNCAETYYYIGGSCIGLLLLVGIITLIVWKCITDRQDRREYERFMKEVNDEISAFERNPIFEAATTTFTNPSFIKS